MNVLMIGPGEPNAKTSGLGIAARELGNQLSDRINLTIVEPSSVNIKNEEEFLELQDSWKIAEETALIKVSSILDPYHYAGKEVTAESEVTQKTQTALHEFTKKVVKKTRKLEVDLVYCHDWMTIPAGMKIKKDHGCALVIHIHSLDLDRNLLQQAGWVGEIETAGLESADAVICVSHYTKNRLVEDMGINPQKIHVVHNGFTALPKKKKPKKLKEKVVVFAGRLTPQKGVGTFLEIAENLSKRMPGTQYLIAGTGDHEKMILEAGEYSSIAGDVHFTGFLNRSRLGETFHLADAYCMPSVSEPFGLTALEAAEYGVPVVISKQSGAAEVLSDTPAFDYWDTDGYVHALESLLRDKKHAKAVVSQNRAALEGVSWKNAGNEILEIFKQTLAA